MDDVSVVKNGQKYLQRLYDFLSSDERITRPKDLNSIVDKYVDKNGRLIGWEIDESNVDFVTQDYVKCDEHSRLNGDRFIIDRHTYHFNPNQDSNLKSFRIDIHNKSRQNREKKLHMNTDPSLDDVHEHWLNPCDLEIDIQNFNSVLAIHLCLEYIKREIYPADHDGKIYNRALEGIRRQIP